MSEPKTLQQAIIYFADPDNCIRYLVIVGMFKQQVMYYAGLVELLHSRGIVESGDLKAFDALVSGTKRELLERNVVEDYLESGKMLGVTDLPDAEDC
jgi:hypothetical protein